jgi:hypothetical protein
MPLPQTYAAPMNRSMLLKVARFIFDDGAHLQLSATNVLRFVIDAYAIASRFMFVKHWFSKAYTGEKSRLGAIEGDRCRSPGIQVEQRELRPVDHFPEATIKTHRLFTQVEPGSASNRLWPSANERVAAR